MRSGVVIRFSFVRAKREGQFVNSRFSRLKEPISLWTKSIEVEESWRELASETENSV